MYLSMTAVLDIAQGIERKGIEVYRLMKERFGDPFLDYLIAQEENHIRTFGKLFSTEGLAAPKNGFETQHLDEDYLAAAYADTELFGQVKPTRMRAANLFPLAVSMEKNSLRFYLELLDEIPDRLQAQRELVRRIAGEERQHLRDLLAKQGSFTVPR